MTDEWLRDYIKYLECEIIEVTMLIPAYDKVGYTPEDYMTHKIGENGCTSIEYIEGKQGERPIIKVVYENIRIVSNSEYITQIEFSES